MRLWIVVATVWAVAVGAWVIVAFPRTPQTYLSLEGDRPELDLLVASLADKLEATQTGGAQHRLLEQRLGVYLKDETQRAAARLIYKTSINVDDLAERLESMKLPLELKAELWELKHAFGALPERLSVKRIADNSGGGRSFEVTDDITGRSFPITGDVEPAERQLLSVALNYFSGVIKSDDLEVARKNQQEQAAVLAQRRNIVAKAAAVLLLPPLLAYLVGSSVAWVRRGFQSS